MAGTASGRGTAGSAGAAFARALLKLKPVAFGTSPYAVTESTGRCRRGACHYGIPDQRFDPCESVNMIHRSRTDIPGHR